MKKVNFYDIEEIADELLEFAVIVTRYKNKWVFCKHKERDTWEIPGGHRELNEYIVDTAKRELYEETGAKKFSLLPICVYSIESVDGERFGMLCYSEVTDFVDLPESEMERIEFFDELPNDLTYPLAYLHLFDRASKIVSKDDK